VIAGAGLATAVGVESLAEVVARTVVALSPGSSDVLVRQAVEGGEEASERAEIVVAPAAEAGSRPRPRRVSGSRGWARPAAARYGSMMRARAARVSAAPAGMPTPRPCRTSGSRTLIRTRAPLAAEASSA
jgi:hypothetical protein